MHYLFRNIPHGKAKNGNQIDTRVHFDYISREGKYSHMSNREEDLAWTSSGNMPTWAESPADFWQACEDNKPAKARGYREFLLGLQEELSLEDNIDCVEKLLERTGIKKNHAYSYAIHNKTAAFDKDHQNVHCHLMFNEKIIEKDRQLTADRYFRRYSFNKQGELTGGYKSSREFLERDANMQLRHMWAEIVNTKFAERNMDCRVDERTLEMQRDELAKQGKNAEAALLNRKPAPHLGNAYLNPRTMERIKETIEMIEEKQNQGEEVEVPKDASEEEKKILLFAKDLMLRKLAKAIQKERMAILREEKQAENYSKDEYNEKVQEAYAVTTSDLVERVDELVENSAQIIDSKQKLIDEIDRRIYSEDKIEKTVYEVLFKGQYAPTNKAYADVCKKITALVEEKNILDKAVINHENYDNERYGSVVREINSLYFERKQLGKKIADFKAEIVTEKWQAKRVKVIDVLHDTNKKYLAERKKAYGIMTAEQHKLDRYNKLKEALTAVPANTVVYADKVPKMVNKYTKLEGIKLVGDLPKVKFDGQTYCVISSDKQQDNGYTVKAVKLYDDVSKGKAKVYKLVLTKTTPESKKFTVTKVQNTSETVATYASRTNKTVAQKQGKNTANAISKPAQTKTNPQQQSIRSKAEDMVSKMLASKDMQIPVYWQNNKEKPVDRLQRAEMDLYAGWSL